jgi:seryl-tRNA synthetase
MLDLKWIRENPGELDAGLARRGFILNPDDVAEPFRHLKKTSDIVLAIDEERRSNTTKLQEMQARRNAASKEIGKAKGKAKGGPSAEADALMAEVASLKDEISAAEERERKLDGELRNLLAALPNIPSSEVPGGKDEHDNVEVRRWGKPRDFKEEGFEPKQHFEIGEALGLMDFEAAAKISGARFTVLKGPLARLERALGQFMLDIQTGEHGYTEVSPPLLVKDDAAFGTAQLPKFAEDLFQTADGRWLIPTAEVPLTNLVRESIMPQAELPYRFTALTPCFRAEAGAAGRDTRGMIRQHQFWKTELVSITTAEQSGEEHERMTACAEHVLKKLELPHRTMVLCTGDMGFAARKTYDIEVWLPGQNTYREISSCSVCGDFQARRMNARYRPAEGKELRFVHTLNGSGLAVGRTLVALLENYQERDGRVRIPAVLHPYMNGQEYIGRP